MGLEPTEGGLTIRCNSLSATATVKVVRLELTFSCFQNRRINQLSHTLIFSYRVAQSGFEPEIWDYETHVIPNFTTAH